MNAPGEAGFTLLEVLLSISVIAVLMGITAPVYISFQNRNALDTTSQSVIESLRRSETFARNGRGDTNWGVKLQTGSLIIYKGASYAARDTTADDVVTLNPAMTLGGLGEVNFNELSGNPVTAGTITVTSTANNESDSIIVNSYGMITY